MFVVLIFFLRSRAKRAGEFHRSLVAVHFRHSLCLLRCSGAD